MPNLPAAFGKTRLEFCELRFDKNAEKSILVAENLAYKLSIDRTLFQGVHVNIEAGDRIALVGRNGIGKSTLLKMLTSQISPNTGSVLHHGMVYYLPQISTIRQEITVETVLNFLILSLMNGGILRRFYKHDFTQTLTCCDQLLI